MKRQRCYVSGTLFFSPASVGRVYACRDANANSRAVSDARSIRSCSNAIDLGFDTTSKRLHAEVFCFMGRQNQPSPSSHNIHGELIKLKKNGSKVLGPVR